MKQSSNKLDVIWVISFAGDKLISNDIQYRVTQLVTV